MQSYRCNVTGVVQGVYYRKSVQAAAGKEKFIGYVKNLPDGSVEACVTCNASELQRFLEILKAGSERSRVDNIDISDCDERFAEGFEIRY